MTELQQVEQQMRTATELLRELRRRANILRADERLMASDTLTKRVLVYLKDKAAPCKLRDVVKDLGEEANYFTVASAVHSQVRRGLLRRSLGVCTWEWTGRHF